MNSGGGGGGGGAFSTTGCGVAVRKTGNVRSANDGSVKRVVLQTDPAGAAAGNGRGVKSVEVLAKGVALGVRLAVVEVVVYVLGVELKVMTVVVATHRKADLDVDLEVQVEVGVEAVRVWRVGRMAKSWWHCMCF